MFSRRTCFTCLPPAAAIAAAIERSEPAKPEWHGIPIDRDLYERAKARAAEDGITLEELFCTAVAHYQLARRLGLEQSPDKYRTFLRRLQSGAKGASS